MTQPSNHVVPQRYVKGMGWVHCAEHQAQLWAVVVKCQLVGRYSTKQRAMEILKSEFIRRSKRSRDYKLGQKPGPKPEGVGSIVRGTNPKYL